MKRAVIVLGLLLVVGWLHCMPHFVFRWRAGEQFRGIEYMFSADEEHYLARTKAGYRGQFHLRNIYICEHQYPEGSLRYWGENLLGFMGRVLGFPFWWWIIISRVVCAGLALVCLYLVLRTIGASFYAALVLALLALLSPYALLGQVQLLTFPVFDYLFHHGVQWLWYEQFTQSPLPWSRLVNPQVSGIFFLVGLLLLLGYVRKPHRWYYLPAFLLLFYLTVKLYFYWWSTLLAFLMVLVLLCLIMKERRIALPLLVMLILMLLMGHRYVLQILQPPNLHASLTTYVLMRQPVISPAVGVALLLLVAAAFSWPHIRGRVSMRDLLIFCSAQGTILVVMNQQLVTGRVVQPWHYELFVNPLLLVIGLFYLCSWWRVGSWLRDKVSVWLAQEYPVRLLAQAAVLALVWGGMVMYFLSYFQLTPRMNGALVLILAGAISLLFLGMVLITMIMSLCSRLPKLEIVLWTLLTCVLLLEGFNRQLMVGLRGEHHYLRHQQLASVFEWLRGHGKGSEVVLAGFEISELLPIYTSSCVYLCKNALHEPIPLQEIRQRLLNYFAIQGSTPVHVREQVQRWPYRYLVWGLREVKPEKDLYGFGTLRGVSEAEVETFVEEYKKNLSRGKREIEEEFRLDFVLESRREPQYSSGFANDPRWQLVFQDSTFSLWGKKNFNKKFH